MSHSFKHAASIRSASLKNWKIMHKGNNIETQPQIEFQENLIQNFRLI